MSSYAHIYSKRLVADRRNGNIYELDFDTFDDNGDTIIRQRDTVKISGKELGFPGKEIFMDRLELVIETGTGIITGQGSDPRIMMSYSDDGGRTWSPEQWGYIGKMGDFTYSQNPYWTDLGSFHERQFRFKVSDPVKVTLISANADISVGV
jgi:Neuraminidase (sialidase)